MSKRLHLPALPCPESASTRVSLRRGAVTDLAEEHPLSPTRAAPVSDAGVRGPRRVGPAGALASLIPPLTGPPGSAAPDSDEAQEVPWRRPEMVSETVTEAPQAVSAQSSSQLVQ